MILVVTNKNDPHADEVIRRLNARKIPVFRLNTEDIISCYTSALSLDGRGIWTGVITDQLGRCLALHDLRVAWLRKPELSFADGDSDIARFVQSETMAFIQTLYALPGVHWVNDPFVASKAKIKFQQLIVARKLGMITPKTVITDWPEAALEFVDSIGGPALTKSIYTSNIKKGRVSQGAHSVKLARSQVYDRASSISSCVTQIQDYIEKDHEIRVTVVGDKAFGVRIDSQEHPETAVDWRLAPDLNRYNAIELPENIERFCLKFIGEQGLHFGAIDFIVTPDDEYVFLENNPFGQYLWLETATGHPISETMCDLLVGLADRCI